MEDFGLLNDPFGNELSVDSLFQSRTHTEALASLRYAYMKGDQGWVLIAAPGVGKTTLLNHFFKMLKESPEEVIAISIDSRSDGREIVFSILNGLGVQPAEGFSQMRVQLKAALAGRASFDKRVIVVVDDAHSLSDSALEEVNWLLSLEVPKVNRFQIVLSGRPQLIKMLLKPELANCRYRITKIGRLEPLSEKEIEAYIGHRLANSGYRGAPIFTPLALKMISEASGGVPHTINSLCFSVLSLCSAMKRKQADVHVVAEAIANLELPIELNKVFTAASEFAVEEHAHISYTQSERTLSESFSAGRSLWPINPTGKGKTYGPEKPESSFTAKPKLGASAVPTFWQCEEVQPERNSVSNSILKLTVILVGIVSAFVLGAVGCLLLMEHIRG